MTPKIIYHIFPAHMTHLSPQLIIGFHKMFPNFKQTFIVYGKESEKTIYNEMDKTLGNIKFISNTKDLRKIISKDKHILLHSLIPEICKYTFFHSFSNISVVCWGSGIKLVNFKNYLLYPLKMLLYHSFKYMITLMEPDRMYLKNKYFVKNILNQPYIGEREIELKKYMESRVTLKNQDGIKNIYVGNNSTCIKSYLRIAQNYLCHIRGEFNLQFMLHYDYSSDDKDIIELKDFCDLNYKSYSFNTALLNLKEYVSYIDKCDIYICDEERQTGLAAIYTALRLGKKIYLNGNNYDWVTSLGCVVHHTNELLNISFENLISEDSEDIIKNNQEKISTFENIENKITQWDYILNLI